MMKHKEHISNVPLERIKEAIFEVRDQKVMLDEDLARLYQVPTKVLVQAVKRNIKRFPKDFMFRLTTREYAALRSQFVTSTGKTGRRYAPYAFTEHGIAMLSSVLGSERAIDVNIAIIRAFIHMRQFVLSHTELAKKLEALEQRYDAQFKVVFNSIRELMKPTDLRNKRSIGFGRS